MIVSLLTALFWIPAPQGNAYQYDDGGADGVWGNTGSPTIDFCWFHRFDAIGGVDTIERVDLAFGRSTLQCGPPNGTPVNICIWDDPNDDGDPTDAVLIQWVSDVVENTNTSILNEYPVPPTAVDGVFFVGCYMTLPPQVCAAPSDLSNCGLGLAWIACNSTAGGFDPTCLPCNGSNCGPFDMKGDFGGALVWLVRAVGENCGTPAVYCTPKPSSCGGLPQISSTGVPRAGATSGFVVATTSVQPQKTGLLIYSNAGPAAVPFQGGLLCVRPPLKRSVPVTDSTGTPGQCDGMLSLDMNCFASGLCGGNPASFLATPGSRVNCQWWGRDTPTGSLLSDGLEYVVCD